MPRRASPLEAPGCRGLEAAEVLIYLLVVTPALAASYLLRRDLVSPAAALLTAYYASLGSGMAVVSSITVVLSSMVRISASRPFGSRRVLAMKLRYLVTATLFIAVSAFVAFVAFGSALSVYPTAAWPTAMLIAVLLYLALSHAVVPSTTHLISRRLWSSLEVEHLESLLYGGGVLLGGVVMFANVVLHGLLGLLLMLAYVASLLATRRLKPVVHKLSVALVTASAMAVTYVFGYA